MFGTINPLLGRYPHPGKYEGEMNLTEKLDSDGFSDNDTGDVETFGHYQLFTGLHLDSDLGDLGGIKAAILETNSLGFVTGHYYDTEEEALDAFSNLENEYAASMTEEEV